MQPEVLEIVQRHARLHKNGFPMKCRNSPIWEPELTGTIQYKVIYDDKEKATAARDELEKLNGAPYLRAYPCQRSTHGHYHLTTDRHASKIYARRSAN